MRREPREDTMIGIRRLLALAAAGLLSVAPPLAAQADSPNPFTQPRPDIRHGRVRHPHHGRALERRGHRVERHGERMEHRGWRMHQRGERLERQERHRRHRLRHERRGEI
jgi:Ni/Co efflux regulator RcnB